MIIVIKPSICASFLRLGDHYVTETRAFRRTGRPYFIDKIPNDFRDVGLSFASGQEFTCSIDDIARCYRAYLDTMRRWNTRM